MGSNNFEPVRALWDLDALDDDEIVAGYREFSKDDPWPGVNRGRAYWHGWRNAAIDVGLIEKDDAAAQLAHEWMARQRGVSPDHGARGKR